jgi:hypothetical protein
MSGVRKSSENAAKFQCVQEQLDHRLVVSISLIRPIPDASYSFRLESSLRFLHLPLHFLVALTTQIRRSDLIMYQDVKA